MMLYNAGVLYGEPPRNTSVYCMIFCSSVVLKKRFTYASILRKTESRLPSIIASHVKKSKGES